MTRITAIDNGVTGSITILSDTSIFHTLVPVRKCLDYTKRKNWLNRVDGCKLKEILQQEGDDKNTIAIIERPMVNPKRWKATMSAIRCLEATLIILEDLKIPYQFIDSKEWQKKMLPEGLRKEELKEASYQVAKRLFPQVNFTKDGADSLLIAEYARRFLVR